MVCKNAEIRTCSVYYPDSLQGKVSKEDFFSDLSTTDCNDHEYEFGSLRQVDTVLVSPIEKNDSMIEELWSSMAQKGLLELPTEVKRDWIMCDGHSYVVEIRRNNIYKVSEIEHLEEPEVMADKTIKELAKLITEKIDYPFLIGPD